MALSTFEIYEKLTFIINSGIGRDKCCRFIQYFIMAFLSSLEQKSAEYTRLVDRLSKLRVSMSQTRKVLRFGKEIPIIQDIHFRIVQHQKQPVRMVLTKTLSDLA